VTRVALMGLGAMGSRMAHRLLSAGHELTVWNRSSAATEGLRSQGARVARTPREAAEQAEVVIAMLSDDDASRSVWRHGESGALLGLGRDAVAIEMSTLTPAWCVELAGLVSARSAAFLDAPVVGSRPQAEAGQLVHLVGGSPDTLSRVSSLLSCLGAAAHHVGSHGAGASLKLLVNALFGIQVVALAELLGVARRSQLDVGRVVEVLGTLAVTSPAAKGAAALMQARRHEPMFPIALVEKDFRYALDLAGRNDAQVPLTSGAHGVFLRALSHGSANEHITAAAKLFE
jgi:3-hydroxyisobutyrate dehydrogenase